MSSHDFVNVTLDTMTPYLMSRTRTVYSNMQARCVKTTGGKLPFTLDHLRERVILPRIRDPRCVYCHHIVISESSFQIDHVNPLVRGGSWQLSNLVLCCAECNIVKGPMTGEEFAKLTDFVMGLHPYAAKDLYRRLKIGSNPMAGRLLTGK